MISEQQVNLFHSHTQMHSASLRLVWVALHLVQSDGCWSMSSVSVGVSHVTSVGGSWRGNWVSWIGMAACGLTSLLERCGMCRTWEECDGRVSVAQPLSACWLRPEAAHGGAVWVRRQHVGLPLVPQSGLSVTVSPSLSSTSPGFVKGHKQVGCHEDAGALLSLPPSITEQQQEPQQRERTYSHGKNY